MISPIVFPFHSTYHMAMRVGLLLCILASLPGSAFAQQGAQSADSETVVMTGRVYGPGGGPIGQPIRVGWQSQDGHRPVQYLYTDSDGRFTLLVIPGMFYVFTVPSDGETWATTTVNFIPTRIDPSLDIDLRRLPREQVVTTSPSISVSELRQKIPKKARKSFKEGVELLRRGSGDLGQSQFEQAIRIFPAYVDARNELAVVFLRQNRLKDAEEQLRFAVKTDPGAIRPRMNLAICVYRQERFEDALPLLQEASQLEPDQARIQLYLGIALVRAGQNDKAEPILRRAYELAGKEAADAQFYLARIYAVRKDYGRAVQALENYLRDKPDDPHASQLKDMLEEMRKAADSEGAHPDS